MKDVKKHYEKCVKLASNFGYYFYASNGLCVASYDNPKEPLHKTETWEEMAKYLEGQLNTKNAVVNENQLAELEERFRRYPNVPFEEPLSTTQWELCGQPHLWKVVDIKDNVILLDDRGHGHLALFVGDVLVDCGKDFVKTRHLGKTYVGLSPAYLEGNDTKLFVDK